MRSVLKAQRTLIAATGALAQHTSGVRLISPQDLIRLQTLISNAQTFIARKLAYIAALDLRIMLDRGKFEGPRTSWLEKTVERGLAVCGEAARKHKVLFENKRIDEKQYGVLKEILGREYDVLRVEVERLRAMVVEEVEG
jgi:hypothetical protein